MKVAMKPKRVEVTAKKLKMKVKTSRKVGNKTETEKTKKEMKSKRRKVIRKIQMKSDGRKGKSERIPKKIPKEISVALVRPCHRISGSWIKIIRSQRNLKVLSLRNRNSLDSY